ncbi:hypothetical protein K9B32_00030 [Rhizobium sp. 3T7]|uniref:hypothetical protein n=1 Tax=Rhizobium sp. 3T7 TaxID=2874922 RepID=UPI001CCA4388|nr:hypothetical protein [Rhizobium sp. 3T7]MBZ9788531.1 hypothetical protein [Rhizobium sp. 3T7]
MSAGLAHSPAQNTQTDDFPKRNVDINPESQGSGRGRSKDLAVFKLFDDPASAPVIDPFEDGERAVRVAVSKALDAAKARPQAAQQPAGGAGLGSGGATVPQSEANGNEGPPLPLFPVSEAPSFKGSSSVSRYALLSKIQKLCRPKDRDERGPSVCGCGRPGEGATHVNIHLRYGEQTGEVRAGVSGVYRCKSAWLCPTCAPAKALERAEKVQEAAEATFRRGGTSALVVLTASHSKDQSLKHVKNLVHTASSKARKTRAWCKAVEKFAILGVICGQEVTYSLENGWHYHQHLSVLVDGPTHEEKALVTPPTDPVSSDRIGPLSYDELLFPFLSAVPAAEISSRFIGPVRPGTPYLRLVRRAIGKASGDRIGPPTKKQVFIELARIRAQAAGDFLAEAYKEKIRGAGGKVSDQHGCKVRVAHDAEDASNYTAKGSMAWEVSGACKDETKAETSLTPWDIARAASDGDKFMYARWKEYEKVMPKTRSCVRSAALCEKLGIEPDVEEDEDGEQVFHENDDVVGRVEAPVWSRWMSQGLASTFLARVEYGGEEGFDDAVTATEADSVKVERWWEAKKAEKDEKQADRKGERLLREAANDVRKHLNEAGARRQIADVVERVARDNPDGPRLSEADVLARSRCTVEPDENDRIFAELFGMSETDWLAAA